MPTQNAVRLHVSSTRSCNESWKKQFSENFPASSKLLPLKKRQHQEFPSPPPPNITTSSSNDGMQTIADDFMLLRMNIAKNAESPPSIYQQTCPY
jgi:hypothetical protein